MRPSSSEPRLKALGAEFSSQAAICIPWQERLAWQIETTAEAANCHLVINNSFTGDLFPTVWKGAQLLVYYQGKLALFKNKAMMGLDPLISL